MHTQVSVSQMDPRDGLPHLHHMPIIRKQLQVKVQQTAHAAALSNKHQRTHCVSKQGICTAFYNGLTQVNKSAYIRKLGVKTDSA